MSLIMTLLETAAYSLIEPFMIMGFFAAGVLFASFENAMLAGGLWGVIAFLLNHTIPVSLFPHSHVRWPSVAAAEFGGRVLGGVAGAVLIWLIAQAIRRQGAKRKPPGSHASPASDAGQDNSGRPNS